jgi:hypothetical protein
MRCDDYIEGVRHVSTMEVVHRKIGRGEALRVQDMRTSPDAEPIRRGRVTQKMSGQYVPDEEHVHICLNCTKKKCTGYCSLVSKTTTGKSRKKKETEEEGQGT